LLPIHPFLIAQLLVLLAIANGTPVFAKWILCDRLAWPLDQGSLFLDGRPLFGHSKTLRGLVLSALTTTVCAPLVGLEWRVGAVTGLVAMVGDLFSSFVKRRMNLSPSSMALGLDQVPESLLPLIVAKFLLPLTYVDVLIAVAIFFIGELVLARILYRMGIRDRPY
jgi:CDP-2,3-bis-(O-geranylgeranyl)-sn-glycerol synthase